MPKVVVVGAGSSFTSHLAKDILLIPDIGDGTFALVDIDPERLRLAHELVEKVVHLTGRDWRVVSSVDRRQVMADADYLICTIEVSGVETVRYDNDIPSKYGIDQCIGDTIGPGGVMKALRTIPAWVDILRDAEELCPRALVMNYTNPMSMMTLAAVKVSRLPVAGLCHSVQGTSRQLAGYLGVPYEELTWECAGINHMAWFTRLERDGVDLYPLLRERARDPEVYEKDPVRFEVMLQLGAFVSESSGHFSEYVPYFRKRPDLLRKYCREGYLGGSGFYARNWPQWRKDNDLRVARLASGEEQYELKRSHEFASVVIEAHQADRPAVIHASVLNRGLIENLPGDGVVEVPVLVDGQGYHPCRFGELPPQLAALCQSNMAVFELGVRAALERDREAAIHAMMLDPLSAAVCSPAEIRAMAEELFEAEKEYLPF